MGRQEQKKATSQKSTSLTIVSEVAKREGVPEKELQPPLFEVINPDALDALFTNESSTENMVSISFDYAGYRITIDSDQTVTVQ